VAVVEDVEAAVGEPDPLTLSPGLTHGRREFRPAHHLALGMGGLPLDRLLHFAPGDPRRADPRHLQAGGDVRQEAGLAEWHAPPQSHGERRHGRIAGPGDVEHLLRLRGNHGRVPRRDHDHALFAERDDRRLDGKPRAELPGGLQRIVRSADGEPGHRRRLGPVRRDHRRACVLREIEALGIDHHRNAAAAGRLDHRAADGR